MPQSWDYIHIVCEEGRPRYVNGQEIPNWQQGPTFWEAVHHLFRKGWKLVDDPLAPISDLRIAYQQWLDHDWEELPHHFKRPKN
jgi:hypothetical protein